MADVANSEVQYPQELPFKVSSIERLKTDENNSTVFRAETTDTLGKPKTKIIKELKNISFMSENYQASSLIERANKMKNVFDVIKEHLGEEVVDTDIIVGVGHDGEECILLIQDEVSGRGLRAYNDPEWDRFLFMKRGELQDKIERALSDPQITQIDGIEQAVEWIRQDAVNVPKNVMITPKGQYRLIDVI